MKMVFHDDKKDKMHTITTCKHTRQDSILFLDTYVCRKSANSLTGHNSIYDSDHVPKGEKG